MAMNTLYKYSLTY